MANTYSRIYIHLVFRPGSKRNAIAKFWKDDLYKYITGVIQNQGHKLIAINGPSDHIHILIGYKMTKPIPDLVRDIKHSSTIFVNSKRFYKGKFFWQVGFGAFSCGHSQISRVAKYIEDQEIHHARMTFEQEYIALLKKYEIEYDEKYVFDD